ncbi:MAG: carbamoyltransferase [Deltaproteobacteria bacterium]|nr:carbamoyltransferase [Deltaproteobacteria bacterium]
MRILGVSAHYHDSAAALLIDGKPVAAAQEERFTRKKNDPSFPEQAIAFCLRQGNLSPSELDAVVFFDKPLLKFERILMTVLERAPRGFELFRTALPGWLREKLWVGRRLGKTLPGCREPLYSTHHYSHAASAFFPSPFDRAAVLTIDGVGEWATCSYGAGADSDLRLRRELRFPHSLGLLYSAFTSYLGFEVNEGEYKVMGLAPYGEARYLDLIFSRLMQRLPDGSFTLDLRFFAYRDRLAMTNGAFHRLFGGPPRAPAEPLEERHLDLAASIQQALELVVFDLARHVAEETRERNLCLAGGVALNCVANGRVLREGPFDRVWIQPAAGDAGGALGAAYVAHVALGGAIPPKGGDDLMEGALLGPEFAASEMAAALAEGGVAGCEKEHGDLVSTAVRALAAGKVVGWFQGRMEFGPRALGNRSILADPRVPTMQQTLNQKVKFREGFRPFAPAVLEERAGEFFELGTLSPYMLLAGKVAGRQLLPVVEEKRGLEKLRVPRSSIPAVTHVDGSARIQTVSRSQNEVFYGLLKAFEAQTGCPVLVNTSFNVRGEPIVCSPRDAVRCFAETGLDALALGPFWAEK